MTTVLFAHGSSEAHDTGAGHPERADRIRAVWRALEGGSFDALDRREAPRAEPSQIARVHRPDFVELLLGAVPAEGRVRVDPDTVMSPESGEAALRAAGALIGAVDAVLSGEATNAFCAVRPPGHHAEPARSMGFCLFNNIAIGAAHARAAHGLSRVAVVDFDVHHGNGTQAAFESDAGLFFASTHEYPLYPGTGTAAERGLGNIVNVPLDPGSGSAEFRRAMDETILPALRAFGPELVMVSAGFDAHARDPLATLRFQEEDYEWITDRLRDVAAEKCAGRIVSTLEGGYDLDALSGCVTAHVGSLMRG